MKSWLRLTLIAMTVGGGFTGFVYTFEAIMNSSNQSFAILLIYIVFLALFAFVTASGLLFVHDAKQTGPLIVAPAIQVPCIYSSLFSYKFATGLEGAVLLGSPNSLIGITFNGEMFLGGTWQFDLLKEQPWRSGINFVPLVLLIFLLNSLRNRRSSVENVDRTTTSNDQQATTV